MDEAPRHLQGFSWIDALEMSVCLESVQNNGFGWSNQKISTCFHNSTKHTKYITGQNVWEKRRSCFVDSYRSYPKWFKFSNSKKTAQDIQKLHEALPQQVASAIRVASNWHNLLCLGVIELAQPRDLLVHQVDKGMIFESIIRL